jgi:hypothetical protein
MAHAAYPAVVALRWGFIVVALTPRHNRRVGRTGVLHPARAHKRHELNPLSKRTRRKRCAICASHKNSAIELEQQGDSTMESTVRTRFLALAFIATPLSTTLAQPIECFDPNVQQSGYTGPVIEGELTISPPEPMTLVTPEDMERFERENPAPPPLDDIPLGRAESQAEYEAAQAAAEAERARNPGGRPPALIEPHTEAHAERARALARQQPCEPTVPPAHRPKGAP